MLIALVANGILFSACLTLFSGYHILQGATDGIELALARELAKRGHSIMIVGGNEEELASCKKLVESENDLQQIEVLTVKIDLCDPSLQNYAITGKQIKPDSRDIGILVNNADLAPSETKLFHALGAEQTLEIANLNMFSTLQFTRMILPGMISRGRGCVINISSIFARVMSPYGNIYGPSKAFVNQFTSNMRIEYSDHLIDFIAVTPSNVQTNILDQMVWNCSMVKDSFVAPSAETLARTVVNAISTRISLFTGCFGHAITLAVLNVLQIAGLHKFVAKFAWNRPSTRM